MKMEKRIVTLLISLSILAVVTGIHIYPFSDYYMFSNLQEHLVVYQLAARKADGSETVLWNDDLKPLNRRRVDHVIASLLKEQSDFQWALHFLERARQNDPSLKTLVIQKATLRLDEQSRQLVPIEKTDLFEVTP